MHWAITIVLLDKEKLTLGFTYRYVTKEDVHRIEFGLLFGYIVISLKKKERI